MSVTSGEPRVPDASADFTAQKAAGYDRLLRVGGFMLGGTRHIRKDAVAALDPRPDDRVLDFGCGTGTLAGLIAERLSTRGQVFAVDGSPHMLEVARKNVARGNLFFEQVGGASFGYAADQFDCAISTLVIHEMRRDERLHWLREIWRVLKPEARYVLVDYRKPAGALARMRYWILMRLEEDFVQGDIERGFEHDLAAAGFEDVTVTPTAAKLLAVYRCRKPAGTRTPTEWT